MHDFCVANVPLTNSDMKREKKNEALDFCRMLAFYEIVISNIAIEIINQTEILYFSTNSCSFLH